MTSVTLVSKAASLTRVLLAYAAAIAVGAAWLIAGPATDHLWLDGLIADVLATLVIFGFSRYHRNSSFYDAYWSVAPPLLIGWWWSQADAGASDTRALLVMTVVVVWAVRLTANWVYAFPGLHHEDWRYPAIKQRAGRAEALADLVAIHLIPTLQVFLAMLPAYVAVTYVGRDISLLDHLAVAVGLGAVALTCAADAQMYRFARTKEPGQAMDRGLWGWSRHPNYFGELMFWFSLALLGVATSPGDAWWLFVGAAAMLAMFLGASIPMMEERSLGRRPDYQDVMDRVPKFLPLPPRQTRRRRQRQATG